MRAVLQAEIIALRHQLLVLHRSNRDRRPHLKLFDRLLWVWLSQMWTGWRSELLKNHMKDLVSADFFVVPTISFRILFVFVILDYDRRRPIHFAVTEHPTAEWTTHQLLEAFPWDSAPRYLLRDRDGIYGEKLKVSKHAGSNARINAKVLKSSPKAHHFSAYCGFNNFPRYPLVRFELTFPFGQNGEN